MSVVQVLLEHGADANIGDGSQTPIEAACEYGELSVVEALVESGADPNPPVETTPLSLAFYPIATSIVSGLYRFTPAKTDEALVRLLLSRSANPNVRCMVPRRMMGCKILHTGQSRAMLSRTLMYGAAIMDNAELLRLLFENGADANIGDCRDYYDALEDSCHNGREDVVKVLLANGTSVACRDVTYYRRVGEKAVRHRRSRIVELLFTEGHGFRAQIRDCYSLALDLALYYGY